MMDVIGGKRIRFAISSDFLPVEELTVEFPLHDEIVPAVKEMIKNDDDKPADNGR